MELWSLLGLGLLIRRLKLNIRGSVSERVGGRWGRHLEPNEEQWCAALSSHVSQVAR